MSAKKKSRVIGRENGWEKDRQRVKKATEWGSERGPRRRWSLRWEGGWAWWGSGRKTAGPALRWKPAVCREARRRERVSLSTWEGVGVGSFSEAAMKEPGGRQGSRRTRRCEGQEASFLPSTSLCPSLQVRLSFGCVPELTRVLVCETRCC